MKKRLLWLAELLIWGVILFSTLFISLYIYNTNTRQKYTYYVFFNDVDGLIKGSPVKIQGYQVGYVSNISIVNEDVFVTFIITDKEIKMPEKLSGTVAFTGMGGSKSLELFVPDSKTKTKNYITTYDPRRLQDFYVYSSQTAQTIVIMATDFMQMFDDRRMGMLKNFIKKPTMLHEINKTLDEVECTESSIINKRRNNENRFNK